MFRGRGRPPPPPLPSIGRGRSLPSPSTSTGNPSSDPFGMDILGFNPMQLLENPELLDSFGPIRTATGGRGIVEDKPVVVIPK